jgi:hypothetical protein
MMGEVHSYLKPVKSPLVKKELLRAGFRYVVLIVLLVSVAYLALLARGYKEQALQQESMASRTEEEFVNGGKRFLDYFLSLNSATVEFDHYRAITMMVNEALKQDRRSYLMEQDFFRRVKDAQMMSKIDWGRSRYEVQELSETRARIAYVVSIVLDRRTEKTAHMVLDLAAIEKSDEYPDGIGIESFVDVASEPFKEASK